MSTPDVIRVESEPGLAIITLNDPATLNAMGYTLGRAFRAAVEAVTADPSVRAILLRAEGKHFCAGGNLADMQSTFATDPQAFFTTALADLHAAVLELRAAPVPVIAAVQGFAAGAGANLALAADLIVAAEDFQLFEAFVQVGVSCDCGGALFLPRAIGEKRALYYLLTGEKINATDALAWGLVNRVVPVAELHEQSLALARRLTAGPTRAYGHIKRLVNANWDRDVATHLQAEFAAQMECGLTQDFQRGVNAFLTKEKPVFEGK